ncbi:hypothetical protein GCM10027053_33460 [Intrasporangium mesophilum]
MSVSEQALFQVAVREEDDDRHDPLGVEAAEQAHESELSAAELSRVVEHGDAQRAILRARPRP